MYGPDNSLSREFSMEGTAQTPASPIRLNTARRATRAATARALRHLQHGIDRLAHVARVAQENLREPQ